MAYMLSPASLSGLSHPGVSQVGRAGTHQVRATGSSNGASPPPTPISPTARVAPHGGGQAEGGPPARPLPRGSLLDLSV